MQISEGGVPAVNYYPDELGPQVGTWHVLRRTPGLPSVAPPARACCFMTFHRSQFYLWTGTCLELKFFVRICSLLS